MKKHKVGMFAAASVLAAGFQNASMGITVTTSTDAAAMVAALLPQNSGISVVSGSESYTGGSNASGTFSSGDFLPFTSGIVLSTGNVSGGNLNGPASKELSDNNDANPNADADLNAIVSGTTNDVAVLSFNFIPTTDVISFQYVFASEEYNEYVGLFNDVFAFFLNDENIALLPGTNTPISINNVNNGNPDEDPPIPASNPQFFTDNIDDIDPLNTSLDGLVGLKIALFATGAVTPGEVNTLKLAIGDASDPILDSAVFIKGSSLVSQPPPPPVIIPLPAAAWMGLSTLIPLGLSQVIRRRKNV